MTAELVMLNKTAAAIAADSAATSVIGGRPRITEATKIFPLSGQPVAVMVNGAAELLDLPWQTLVDQYRDELGERTLDRLEDYASTFFAFILSNVDLFPASRQLEHYSFMLQEVYGRILHNAKSYIQALAAAGRRNVTMEQAVRHSAEALLQDYWGGKDRQVAEIKGFSGLTAEKHYGRHKDLIDGVIGGMFRDFRRDEKFLAVLRHIAFLALTRDHFVEIHSGVVFTGFGKRDTAPGCIEYFVSTVFDDKLRMAKQRTAQIRPGQHESDILAFADTGATAGFLYGIDSDIYNFLNGTAVQLLLKLPEDAAGHINLPGGAKGALNDYMHQHYVGFYLQALTSGMWKFIEDTRLTPLYEVIRVAGDQEMLRMATDLVRLNVLAKQVRHELETVGGPVRSMLITRSGGVQFAEQG